MLAWIAILAERHPGVVWVTVTNDSRRDAQTPALTAREVNHSGKHDDAVASG